MKREDYAWAAGLYEGEGSISIRRVKRLKGKQYLQVVLQLTQCGADGREVVQRFADVVGVGSVCGPYPGCGRYAEESAEPKERWHYTVCGLERVQAIIAMLWPWLCSRRRAQIVACMTEIAAYQRAIPNQGKSQGRLAQWRKLRVARVREIT